MLIEGHSGARAALANPEPRNTGITKAGKSRCLWVPGLPFGHPGMTILILIGVVAVLAAGCADSGNAGSDSERHPVFYGGVAAGGVRP